MSEQANIARGSNPVRYQESIIDIKIDLQVETIHSSEDFRFLHGWAWCNYFEEAHTALLDVAVRCVNRAQLLKY